MRRLNMPCPDYNALRDMCGDNPHPTKIAAHFGVSYKVVLRWFREAGIEYEKKAPLPRYKGHVPDGFKYCTKCSQVLPHSAFHKAKNRHDGLSYCCASCRSDEMQRWLKTPRYKQTRDKWERTLRQKANDTYMAKPENQNKKFAQSILQRAVRLGKVAKQNVCSECGGTERRTHGHHDDYAKPLDVRWLCSLCHARWHRANGPGLNAGLSAQ